MSHDADPPTPPPASKPLKSEPPNLKRRSFLQLTAAAAMAAGGATGAAAGVPMVRPSAARRGGGGGGGGRARNVIFMVSDGMSFGTLTLADMFRRRHEQRQSVWLSLLARPGVRRGLYSTCSADSLVTDSSASGSCWGCGYRVNNGVLNITSDGTQRMPILVQASQAGKATGLVTTARVTHATPASFIANAAKRDREDLVAHQLLDRRVDVALGGGSGHVTSDLIGQHADMRVVRDRAALLAAGEKPGEGGRLLGLFAASHVPMVLNREETTPTLAEMSRVALRRLDRNPEGFVVQIEGGRVDHAAHANDAPSLVREQLDFDDAIAEVLRFLDDGKRDDTLVIITTDHGNANPGLTVYGRAAERGFDRLAQAKRSFEWVFAKIGTFPREERAERAPSVIEEATGLSLSADEKSILRDAMAGKPVSPFRELSKVSQVLGGLLANSYGVGFVSGNHTADDVEVTAFGPGCESIAPTGHNQDLHRTMVESLALPPGEPLPDMRERVEFTDKPKAD